MQDQLVGYTPGRGLVPYMSKLIPSVFYTCLQPHRAPRTERVLAGRCRRRWWVGSQQPHTSKPAIDLLTCINAQLIGMLAIHCRLICSNQATRERVPFVLCFIEHPEEGRG